MKEPTFLILTALAQEPLHGYGIIAAVADVSDGKVKLGAGTLYGALDRLTEEGLVEVEREEIVASRLRRYYRLTDAGAEQLAGEAERVARHARAALTRLAARPASGPAFAGLIAAGGVA